MRVELLFWAGCPSHEQALEDLRGALSQAGRDAEDVIVREIRDERQAVAEGFTGSPTIRVDGRDVVDPGDEPPGLTCRLYTRRDGRPSPLPDPADLREALRR
jgi:hypothetical protein